jgi:hypothetical protein
MGANLIRRLFVFVFAVAVLGLPAVARPQADVNPPSEYRPAQRNPSGREIIAVYISASTCVANTDPAFKPAVREVMRRLGAQRDSASRNVTITGVSIDWAPRVGIAYLDSLGEFDEIVSGRNWFNSAATRYVWQASRGKPEIPQIVLLERTVTMGESAVKISGERELARFVGGDSIKAWAARGAPIELNAPAKPGARKPGSRRPTS